MRLKNNPKANDIVLSSKYVNKEINFENNNKICLEIGTGKCDFIIESASKYPDINFIGVEKYASVLVSGVKKLENLELNNLKLLLLDANNIDEVFDKKIDTLYLNFSDPWPKKRHAKRRLTSPIFLEKYNKIFKGNPHIILKTDNRSLFEYSLVSLSNFGYVLNGVSLDYNDENNILTEYEKKFREKGMPIYYLDAELYKNYTVKEK